MQEASAAGVAQCQHEVGGGADEDRGRGADGRAGRAHRRQAQLAEDQHIADQDVERVHPDQRVHVQAGHIHGAPVAAEREIHADGRHRHQPPLPVNGAFADHIRVVDQQRVEAGRQPDQQQ